MTLRQLSFWTAISELEVRGQDAGTTEQRTWPYWGWCEPWLLPDGRVIVRLPCRNGVGGYAIMDQKDEQAEKYRMQLERTHDCLFPAERLQVQRWLVAHQRDITDVLAEAVSILRGKPCLN